MSHTLMFISLSPFLSKINEHLKKILISLRQISGELLQIQVYGNNQEFTNPHQGIS